MTLVVVPVRYPLSAHSRATLERARYVVRSGFLVEETILDEVASEAADYVVIGGKQRSRWRRMIRRLLDDPDVEGFLRRELDCEVITASP